MTTLKILTLKSLRQYQDGFDTGRVSCSAFCVDVFNQLFYKEHDSVKLIINSDFFPVSYARNPTAWSENHKDKIKYPHLCVRHEHKVISITASHFKIISNFTKLLAFELQQNQVAKFRKENIPNAYVINPYQIIRRLKLNAKVLDITPTHIIWKLRK